MWLPLLIILLALILWSQEQITVTIIEQPPIATTITATAPRTATTTESADGGRQIHIRKINSNKPTVWSGAGVDTVFRGEGKADSGLI